MIGYYLYALLSLSAYVLMQNTLGQSTAYTIDVKFRYTVLQCIVLYSGHYETLSLV